jgi:hypothetical protein
MSCFVAFGGERDIYTSTHEQGDSVTRMRTDHLCYDVVDIYIYIYDMILRICTWVIEHVIENKSFTFELWFQYHTLYMLCKHINDSMILIGYILHNT